jgi:hypothetical protein
MLGLWTVKGGWIPSMVMLPVYMLPRVDIFSECLAVVEAICRGNSKYGSWVHCLNHPQGLSPSIPSPPIPSQSNSMRFLFCLSWDNGKSMYHNPYLGLLLSPSSLPELAHLPLTHTHTHTQTACILFIVASFLIPFYVDV